MRGGLKKVIEFYKNERKKTEILIPEYSHFSNLTAILNNDCKPVYVPVDKISLNINPDKIEPLITKNTLGILLTHMHGRACDMDKVMTLAKKYNLLVFEDCAHACGGTYENKKLGSFGVGCFSFGFGKILTTFGGGAVTTNDNKLYLFLKNCSKQNEGNDIKIYLKSWVYYFATHPIYGIILKPVLKILIQLKKDESLNEKVELNSTFKTMALSNFQAAVGLKQIKNLDKLNQKRIEIADIFQNVLLGKETESNCIYFHYPIRVADPKTVKLKMLARNVDVQDDYCNYLPKIYDIKKIKNNEANFKNIIYLPTTVSQEKAKEIAREIKKYFVL